MGEITYDAIVVGARCAGSATARLLVQAGLRVLVVDRATFPSDTVSTHCITTGGCIQLQRWGLFDRVLRLRRVLEEIDPSFYEFEEIEPG